ncbi:MAG: NAD(P)H-dependent oxidoreductase [Gemmataceae bacterium]
MASPTRIVAFAGSLRKASYNAASLRVLQELVPAGVTVAIHDLAGLPLFNEDIEKQGLPASVETFRQAIAAADGVVIATPEYNYSVPGVLKNAIDWASRPPQQPFDSKPVAIFGASPGFAGTARAQYHLRQMFIYLNAYILNRPEVFISAAHTKFDAEGNLTDEATRKQLGGLLEALLAAVEKHRTPRRTSS